MDEQTFYEAKAYAELVDKVQFRDFYVPPPFEHLQPFIYFYKFLAKKPEFCKKMANKHSKLHIWIPDTVIFND